MKLKRYGVISLLACLLLLLALYSLRPLWQRHSPTPTSPRTETPLAFISYWMSWAVEDPHFVVRKLCEIPQGVDWVMVAFALEKPDNSGLSLQMPQEQQELNNGLQALHAKGIKVLLSTGGANGAYPWLIESLNNETIIEQYLSYLNKYPFDGLDFDVEQGDLSRLPAIIQGIKQQKPNLVISLTVPSAGVSGMPKQYNQLAQQLYQAQQLRWINFMNYDHYGQGKALGCRFDSEDPRSNCYIQNILGLSQQIQQWTHSEQRAKQLISNGIMIGYADDKELVTPALSARLTQWLQSNGYGAVMTWGLNRDQASCQEKENLNNSTGMSNIPIGAFTNRIIDSLAKE
jgi:hypothetical protein